MEPIDHELMRKGWQVREDRDPETGRGRMLYAKQGTGWMSRGAAHQYESNMDMTRESHGDNQPTDI